MIDEAAIDCRRYNLGPRMMSSRNRLKSHFLLLSKERFPMRTFMNLTIAFLVGFVGLEGLTHAGEVKAKYEEVK